MKPNSDESDELARFETHEEESELWLISYADMMTLLAGFFIMLLSFSKIDAAKFEQIKKETTKVFGGEYKQPFETLSAALKKTIQDNKVEEQVLINQTDEGLEITFRGALFFETASSDLKEQAVDILTKIIPSIITHAKGYGVLVEGHTDNRPVVGGLFKSNWELSSLRACAVVRFFQENGFEPQKLKSVGWAEHKPILPNQDQQGSDIPENQSQNRRVVIKIVKDFVN